MRYSFQRETILSVLHGCTDHPTAETVFERVRKVCPNVSLGTVYRNLKQLVEEGLIVTVETTDASVHYDGRVATHAHFVCESCGKIIDVFDEIQTPQSLAKAGAKVISTKAVFYGTCSDCAVTNLN